MANSKHQDSNTLGECYLLYFMSADLPSTPRKPMTHFVNIGMHYTFWDYLHFLMDGSEHWISAEVYVFKSNNQLICQESIIHSPVEAFIPADV